MDAWQGVSSGAASLLSLATLAGLLWRGRFRRCFAFGAYLALVAFQGARLAMSPGPPSWSLWLSVEGALRVLCFAVAVELAWRLFRSLPVAAQDARGAIVAVLAVTVLLLVIDLPTPQHPRFAASSTVDVSAFQTAQRWLPRLAYGSAWLFGMLLAIATSYGLPLDPLHRVLLVGFAAYLLLYAVTLATMPGLEGHAQIVSSVQTAAFLGLLGLWAYVAWRAEPRPPASLHVVRRLWPWL